MAYKGGGQRVQKVMVQPIVSFTHDTRICCVCGLPAEFSQSSTMKHTEQCIIFLMIMTNFNVYV